MQNQVNPQFIHQLMAQHNTQCPQLALQLHAVAVQRMPVNQQVFHGQPGNGSAVHRSPSLEEVYGRPSVYPR